MFKDLLKGMVVGIANIIPGVSGGTMLVSMGIYDKLIYCITHLFSEFKANVKFLFPIFLGAVIALLGLSFIIEPAFEVFPLQTNFLFIGLIMGGIPAIYGKLKSDEGKLNFKISYFISFLIFFAIVVGMAMITNVTTASADLSTSLGSMIKMFVVGIIASATMVVPGVSGSMVLLLIGYYTPILHTINAFVKSFAVMNWDGMIENGLILTPFAIGIVVGVFAIAKAIEIIFAKFPIHAYWAILGLIVASPIGIMIAAKIGAITVISVVVSVILFVVGFYAAIKLGD